MALQARLELRQGQSLVITPQLQQAIKLLQLSNLELESFIEGELEKNPLLDRIESDGPVEAAPEADAPVVAEAEMSFSSGVGEAAEASMDVRSDDSAPA